jgi:uncharacterized protein (TIGR04551 family)
VLSALLLVAPLATAQPPEEEPVPAEEEPGLEEDLEEEGWGEEEEPRLRPPEAESLSLEDLEEDEEAEEPVEEEPLEEEELEEPREDDELPSPAQAQDRLDRVPGEDSDPTLARWTTPQTVFDLDGYIRVRGNFWDNFFLDRVLGEGLDPTTGAYDRGSVELPFALFRPAEDGVVPEGGCTGDDPNARCDQHALAFANMRLRLEPTIHLSDDVRVHMQLDVFDNLVLGSTPNSLAVGPRYNDVVDPYFRYERTTFAPFDTATTTLAPPRYGFNNLTDSIIARRAWAEVRNRGLGELRFGRMGDHFGLGILSNGGDGIDSDYQTDVDRIMLITRLAGIYLFGSWDFASEGLLYQEFPDVGGLPFDRSRLDDTDQFIVGAAYRATEEEQTAALQRGDAVFNVGARFIYRNQNLTSAGTPNPFNLCVICAEGEQLSDAGTDPVFVRRGADIYIPDLWMQFLWEDLRLELEAVMVFGSIQNLASNDFVPGPDGGDAAELLQLGLAFEGEYHLLNDQLGIYFAAGYASGDADQEGLSLIGGLPQQLPAGPTGQRDTTYSTFYFHPNYRIDLIFWRNIVRQVAGAYYFKPGLSYDFIRNSFGQLLGARADVIWSRAAEPVQAWGNADDLGVEIDVSLYYRSEDGPELMDGFYASVQWGIFFPLDGVGFLPGTTSDGEEPPGLGNAQAFRLILGVQY